jgi:hypothetical protein
MKSLFATGSRMKLSLALAAALSLAAAASIAWATIPDANGVFHACVNTNSGILRLIDNEQGETCNPNESAVSWQTGSQGGPTLFANVNANGTLVSGSATNAARVSTGHYFVTFDQDVSECAGVVTPGFTASSEGRAEANLAIVSTGHGPLGPKADDVELLFTPVTPPTEGDTAFHLVVVC